MVLLSRGLSHCRSCFEQCGNYHSVGTATGVDLARSLNPCSVIGEEHPHENDPWLLRVLTGTALAVGQTLPPGQTALDPIPPPPPKSRQNTEKTRPGCRRSGGSPGARRQRRTCRSPPPSPLAASTAALRTRSRTPRAAILPKALLLNLPRRRTRIRWARRSELR